MTRENRELVKMISEIYEKASNEEIRDMEEFIQNINVQKKRESC